MELKVRFTNPDQTGAEDGQTAVQEATINVPDGTTLETVQDALDNALTPLTDGGIKPVWMLLYTPD
ncbi:MAG: hypothetical protein WC358_00145 [Ignavibacteria bacterium]|jgi:hypothetical protein